MSTLRRLAVGVVAVAGLGLLLFVRCTAPTAVGPSSAARIEVATVATGAHGEHDTDTDGAMRRVAAMADRHGDDVATHIQVVDEDGDPVAGAEVLFLRTRRSRVS